MNTPTNRCDVDSRQWSAQSPHLVVFTTPTYSHYRVPNYEYRSGTPVVVYSCLFQSILPLVVAHCPFPFVTTYLLQSVPSDITRPEHRPFVRSLADHPKSCPPCIPFSVFDNVNKIKNIITLTVGVVSVVGVFFFFNFSFFFARHAFVFRAPHFRSSYRSAIITRKSQWPKKKWKNTRWPKLPQMRTLPIRGSWSTIAYTMSRNS